MAKMEEVSVRAHAKVNFTLDVTGRAGGYHLLDSLVCTVSLFDEVRARRRRDGALRLNVGGADSEHIPPESNAARAARAFFQAFGGQGADILIERHIPVGAGLGSSSADAAGVLLALARLYHIADMVRLKAIADGLGSDTGYLLTGGWARMTGRGELIERIADMPSLDLLLLCPAAGTSTAQCFAEYDRRGEQFPPRTQAAIAALRAHGAGGAYALGNALTRAACACNALTAQALEEAARLSPSGCGVTGSGSACYAVFAGEEACLRARAAYRGTAAALCVHTTSGND